MTQSITRHQKPATVREIAKRAGVSPSTVSRVLNGHNKGAWSTTAERTRLIRDIAERLNYKPSFHARAFHTGRTNTIGLLFNDDHPMLDGVYGTVARAEVDVFRESGYDLALHAVRNDQTAESDLLLDRRFDGYLVHNHLEPVVWESIERAELPAVLVNGKSDMPIAQVRPDDESAAFLLTEHLMRQGHRRVAIALVASYQGQKTTHSSTFERLAGYRRALASGGLSDFVIEFEVSQPGQIVEALLDSAPDDRATALIVTDDRPGALALQAFQYRGVRVPGDLAIAAFNDTPMPYNSTLAQYVSPALTVMRMPFAQMGRHAASLLMNALEPNTNDSGSTAIASTRLLLPAELVVRGSTDPRAQ